MRWQSLPLIPIESWFSPELMKSAAAVNEQIKTLLTARREFDLVDSAGGKLAKADVIELDFGDLLTLHSPRVELARVLQAELKLRTAIATWLDREMQPAFSAHYNDLSAQLETARAKIQQALERLGYHPFQTSTPDPCKWIPGMVESHPTVHALRNEALMSRDTNDARSENHRAVQETTRLLEKLRDDAVAAANLSV